VKNAPKCSVFDSFNWYQTKISRECFYFEDAKVKPKEKKKAGSINVADREIINLLRKIS
jgi:hypothetical protein